MSRRGRLLVAGPALLVLAGLLAWAAFALPRPDAPPGRVAETSVQVSVHERRSANTVNAITYDVRGIDTLGEELILFVAAIGSSVLLRAQRGERAAEDEAEADEERREAVPGPVRALGAGLVGPVLVLGGYLVSHGQLSPGGGFQGGVLLAGALLLVYAAGQLVGLQRVRPAALVEVAEATGAAAYGLVALGGLVFAGTAMANFLPLGEFNALWSAGTIPVLSVAVGVEVAGAVTLILSELLEQTLLQGARG